MAPRASSPSDDSGGVADASCCSPSLAPDPDPGNDAESRRHNSDGRGASFFAKYNPHALHSDPTPSLSLRQYGVSMDLQFTHTFASFGLDDFRDDAGALTTRFPAVPLAFIDVVFIALVAFIPFAFVVVVVVAPPPIDAAR